MMSRFNIFASLLAIGVVVSGCTMEEYQQQFAEDTKPRVFNVTPVSVTISQYGNAMTNRAPLPASIALANETCINMGFSSASHASFTDPDKASSFDPEFMRNHQLFLCQK